MKDNEKIITALDGIDDKDLVDARPRGIKARKPIYRIGAIAACLVLAVSVVLFALLMGGGNPQNVIPPAAEKPFPEVPRPQKSLASAIADYLLRDDGYDDTDDFFGDVEEEGGVMVPDDTDTGAGSSGGENNANGSYTEVTDNQIDGIIEGDLWKSTDKYIFRYRRSSLFIYSIDGDNSTLISEICIGSSGNDNYADMFLSQDGNTVTLINEGYDAEYAHSNVIKVYSVDVSDIESPRIARTLVFVGMSEAVRKIGDEIYLVNSVAFPKKQIDTDRPESYIPGIIEGEEIHICDTDRIFYPEEIENVMYRYITVLRESDLALVDEYAILTNNQIWPSDAYFTDDHIILESQSGRAIEEESIRSEIYTEIDLIDFSGEGLRYRGRLEMSGWADNQYYYDEHEGHLRVVTSTRRVNSGFMVSTGASLFIYDLSTMTLVASLEDFAPEGEQATAVRFDDDRLYVCTAEISSFTDPVFYFDLSDYENITQVNTGFIEGFSSSLIDLGEGYLLGIGRESRSHMKIEIYKREGESVVSVAKQVFIGNYDTDYHSYLIDREKNLFGLAVNYTKEGYGVSYGFGYFLWHFDAESESLSLLTEISSDTEHTIFAYARAFVRDGYLYLTSANNFTPLVVKKIELK